MPETMLIPSKWYQSSSVSGDLAGSLANVPVNSEFADMFSQPEIEAKIDAITNRLCQNIEKIFEDAISRIRSGLGVIREDSEDEEHQVREKATSEWSCGEEAWSGGAETNGSGKFFSVLPGDLSGGEDGFATGGFGGRHGSAQGGAAGNRSSEKCNCLERNSLGGVFERGGAGGDGAGGGPGFYAGETGGVVGCWSSECGPEIMNVVLSSGVRNGDFSSGFSGGSDRDGGTLVGGCTGPLVSGRINGGHLELLLLGVFQKCLEREVYDRRLSGSLVGLERKTEMEYASKGILVIPLIAIIKDLNQLWSPATNVMNGRSGLTDLRPNFPSPTLITQSVNYHSLAFHLITSLLIRSNSLTHKSQFCTSSIFGDNCSPLSITAVAEVIKCCRGRASSSDYKPP